MITVECQQMREMLDSYLAAELLVETNHQILRHLSGCNGCRAELARRQRLRLLMKAVLPAEDPPAELVRRISQIPRGDAGGGGVPIAARVRSMWHRFGGRVDSSNHHRRSSAASRTWLRQVLAGGTLAAAFLVLVGLGQWSPWMPARLTASELLDRSDKAARAMAERSDVVLHRSLNLEERRGANRKVVARRRVEVWHNGTNGALFRRAFDERNALVAAESLTADGGRTVYRPGAPPRDRARPLQHARLRGLAEADDNSAWRLDLSATAYTSLIPAGASVRVEDRDGHYLVSYEAGDVRTGDSVVAATLKLRRDTLLPIEQTVLVDRGGEVSEVAMTEAELETVPRHRVPAAVFEPDAILTGGVNRGPARIAEAAVAPPAAVVAPSVDTELALAYRLHRMDAWLRDAVSLTRTAEGALEVSAIVATAERRGQLLAVLTPAAAGVAIDVRVEPRDAALPAKPPAPPEDLHSMAAYERLRAGFTDFILSRVPAAERPSPEEQNRLVEGLVRSLAARNLERSDSALNRAAALEKMMRHFSSRTRGELSPDSEATLQTMLRDHARGIGVRLEALRLELQPMMRPPVSSEPPAPPAGPPDLGRTAQQLIAVLNEINAAVLASFGPNAGERHAPDLSDPGVWRAIAEGERLAAIFKEPLPLGGR